MENHPPEQPTSTRSCRVFEKIKFSKSGNYIFAIALGDWKQAEQKKGKCMKKGPGRDAMLASPLRRCAFA
jgi:hypothetical protein